MSCSSELYYQLALSRVPQVGPIIGRHILAECGRAEEVFHTPPRQLRKIKGVSDKIIGAIRSERPIKEAEAILQYAERSGLRVLAHTDDQYPSRLKAYEQAPLILFVQGPVDLNPEKTVAVIGTRKASREGLRQTQRLLEGLVDHQPVVVSGLAFGIDIEAHKHCLKLGLPTVGVLGSGHDCLYPREHMVVARKMLEQGGLISTYPYWQKPEREHFPARNRIVAMLADCAVVVESAERGGSIITIRMAKELGKPVGACPGRGGHPHTNGCNALIKSDEAEMIRSAEDIIDLVGWKPANQVAKQAKLFAELSTEESIIVAQFKEDEELLVDDLRRQLNWSSALLAAKLLAMECKGLVDVLPGQRYRLSELVAF